MSSLSARAALSCALRFFAVWSWIACTLPLLWLAVPLRPLNLLLRPLGAGDFLPLDVLSRMWARSLLWMVGVGVELRGEREHAKRRGAGLVLANHTSGVDALALLGYVPSPMPKAIFKRSLMFYLAPIFLLAKLYGHVPIDRRNRASAIASLDRAARKIAEYGRSILIFPEGTRSSDGHLQAFKKGPFHLAVQHAGLPLYPIVVGGAGRVLPPRAVLPRRGIVTLTMLERIVPAQHETHDAVAARVHAAMSPVVDANVRADAAPGAAHRVGGAPTFVAAAWLLASAYVVAHYALGIGPPPGATVAAALAAGAALLHVVVG